MTSHRRIAAAKISHIPRLAEDRCCARLRSRGKGGLTDGGMTLKRSIASFAAALAVSVVGTIDPVGIAAAQTSGPTSDWVGRLIWKHRVEGRGAWAETEGKADVKLTNDGGRLAGTMVGSHSATSGGPCTGTTVAPAGFQAKLAASYTPGPPGQDAIAIQASEKQTTPMHMQISCPGAPPVVSHHPGFYENYEKPLGGLRPTGDGGFLSHDVQTAPGEAGSTMTTTYTMTLKKQPDCRSAPPSDGIVFPGPLGSALRRAPDYSAQIRTRVARGQILKITDTTTTTVGNQRWLWYYVQGPSEPAQAGWVRSRDISCDPNPREIEPAPTYPQNPPAGGGRG